MRLPRPYSGTLCSILAVSMLFTGTPALQAEEFAKALHYLATPFRALHHEKPETGQDDDIEQLANEIDWLESHIDKFGSVVTKHPDIWGESRLMRHRYEYEEQMSAQMGEFEVRLNGALRRSDQAFLGMAFALQAASNGGTLSEASSATSSVSAMISTSDTVIDRTGPFARTQDAFSFEQESLSLEPTIQLDQMSRYLNHLNELRRINEGDDIADSPGYSLNLVRIPVSILPGKHTRKGYGAEVTIIAEPQLSEDLLPITFRDLVINDLVDMLAPALTALANHPEISNYARVSKENENYRAVLESITIDTEKAEQDLVAAETLYKQAQLELAAIQAKPADQAGQKEKELDHAKLALCHAENQVKEANLVLKQAQAKKVDSEAGKVQPQENQGVNQSKARAEGAVKQQVIIHLPSSKSRRAQLPIPASQISEVFGSDQLLHLAVDICNRLGAENATQQTIHLMDVRAYLTEELHAAYRLLAGPDNQDLWTNSGPVLATAIHNRQIPNVATMRCAFFKQLSVMTNTQECTPCQQANCFHSPVDKDYTICKTETASLAWAIVVESSLLNQRLIQDIQELSSLKNCPINTGFVSDFYLPYPSPEARMVFNEYVKCRWPVRVFALDPVSQDQNIQDEYARRREMQVAIALAFASGEIGAQSMMRYTRRLEWDMATIALNQTTVGFSHGNDTFGWRFHPRFQTPPVKGTIATFGETLFGGPTTDSDLRQRQLEPGIRECTAIVVMPSFVPYVRFDVRTNWFCLTHPKQTELSMRDTMELSRSIKAMQMSAAQCSQCAHLYRDGEVDRLLRRVDQLDRELPLQTMIAQVPYENTTGGYELFNNGITDLAPELLGWYGAPGINPSGPTTMFLMGDGFSVHETQLTAGGMPVPFKLLSRQVMQVTIPPGIQIIPAEPGSETNFEEVVDLHLATPYGVSSHLHVPVASPQDVTTQQPLAWTSGVGISLNAVAKQQDGDTYAVTIDEFVKVDPPVLAFSAPALARIGTRPTIQLQLGRGQDFIGAVTLEVTGYDPQANVYFINGSQLQDQLVGSDSKSPKTGIKGLINPYLKYLVERTKQESGTVDIVGQAFLLVDESHSAVPISGPFNIKVELKKEEKPKAASS